MKTLKLIIVFVMVIGIINYYIYPSNDKVKAYELYDRIESYNDDNAFIIKGDGTLWGWGNNENANLGRGTKSSLSGIFGYVSGSKEVVKVAAGKSGNYYLKGDGTVWGWGNPIGVALGDGTTEQRLTPTQIKNQDGTGFLTDIIDISVSTIKDGNYLVAALNKDGEIYIWGVNDSGFLGAQTMPLYPKKLLGVNGVEKFTLGIKNIIFLKTDGTLWGMGQNNGGDLGTPDGSSSTVPVQINGVTNIKSLISGENFSGVLKSDGTVWMWGSGVYGVMGNGTTTNQNTPKQVPGLTNIIKLKSGSNAVGALDANGDLWVWGNNLSGQLGIGNKVQQNSPVKNTNVTKTIDFSLSNKAGYTLQKDGKIFSWGANNKRQLGNYTGSESLVPIEIFARVNPNADQLGNVLQMHSSYYHSVALKKDGTVWTWGSNSRGELGDGTTISRNKAKKVAIDNVVKVTNGYVSTYALKDDGTVWGWGKNTSGELGTTPLTNSLVPIKVPIAQKIKDISAFVNHVVAVDENGEVWSWGENTSGQVDPSAAINAILTPRKITGLTDVIQVEAGNEFSVALKRDGTVWAWGNNSLGQLGNGTKNNSGVIQVLGGDTGQQYLTNIRQISVGEGHVLALREDDTVWSWGSSVKGQLGNGSYTESLIPAKAVIEGVKKIETHGSHNLALKYDGTVWGWGNNANNELASTDTNLRGLPFHMTTLVNVIDLSVGNSTSFYIKSNNTVESVGYNIGGQLADGTNTNKTTTVKALEEAVITNGDYIPFDNVKKIVHGKTSVAAIKNDGTVWTWGNGEASGKLGNSDWQTVQKKPVPSQIQLTNVTDIAMKENHVLALKGDGTVWTWGDNTTGQLGRVTSGNEGVPTQINIGATIVSVSAGRDNSFAVDSTGMVWAWGSNTYFQTVPAAPNTVISVPTKISKISNVSKVSAGFTHTTALKKDGTVVSWGIGTKGELGDNTMVSTSSSNSYKTPLVVGGITENAQLTGIGDLSAGYSYSTALATSGSVYSWGDNGDKTRLGVPNGKGKNALPSSSVPVKPAIEGVIKLDSGYFTTFAVKSDGTLWVWGENYYNALGTSIPAFIDNPLMLNDVSNVRDVATGSAYTTFHIHTDNTVTVRGGSITSNESGDGLNGTGSNVRPVVQEKPIVPEIGPAYFEISKVKNFDSTLVDITLTEKNVVDGFGKVLKYAEGNQTFDYFRNNGNVMNSNKITVSENGYYTFYLKDARGYEWKQGVSVQEISSWIDPVIKGDEREWLISGMQLEQSELEITYSNYNPNFEYRFHMRFYEIQGFSTSQYKGRPSPIGENITEAFTMNLEEMAWSGVQRLVLGLINEKGAIVGREKIVEGEIYEPRPQLYSTINSISLDWIPSLLTDVSYVLKRDGEVVYNGYGTDYVDENVIDGQVYQYTLEAVHNGKNTLVYQGTKKAGSYTFQTFGNIDLGNAKAVPNTEIVASSITNETTDFVQIADVKQNYSINVKLSPFRSSYGNEISAENFSMEGLTMIDSSGNIIEEKSLNFINDVAVSLVSETETSDDKGISLKANPSNFKFKIPETVSLTNLEGEIFNSNLTYQVQWAP